MIVIETKPLPDDQSVENLKPRVVQKRLRSPVDRQRAAFLQGCRARIDPAEHGFPTSRRKRTAGLRRSWRSAHPADWPGSLRACHSGRGLPQLRLLIPLTPLPNRRQQHGIRVPTTGQPRIPLAA
jgi:hypothetical protein